MSPVEPIVAVAMAGWCVQAWLAWRAARHLERKLAEPPRPREIAYRPRVRLITPFKGLDDDPARAAGALLAQDYPDYDVTLVVESEADPAHAALEAALACHAGRRARIVVAGPADGRVAQKVHNQLAALDAVERDSADDDVWVFADSDAVPDAGWLGRLVGPLGWRPNAVTTGYRWLVASPGRSGRTTLWSHLASVMNASVACLQAHAPTSQAWGGAMAMRAGDARAGRLRDRWRGAITDDYPVTALARDLGRPVRFVPACLVPSPVDYRLRGPGGLAEFAHRQYLITRIYAPWLLAVALGASALYVGASLLAWGWLAAGLASGAGAWWLPLPAMAAVHGLNHLRAGARRRCAARVLGGPGREPRATRLLDRWATPWWMALHGALAARALLGRTLRWRGVRYRVRGPNEVERLDPAPACGRRG